MDDDGGTAGVQDLCEDEYYALQDQQFNVLAITDDTGAVVERYEYDLYGERTVLNEYFVVLYQSGFNMNCGFQGLYHDVETGLVYNRARMLSSRLERFMQRDPLGYPDGMNTYAAYHVLRGGVDPYGLEVEVIRNTLDYREFDSNEEMDKEILKDMGEKTSTGVNGIVNSDVTNIEYKIIKWRDERRQEDYCCLNMIKVEWNPMLFQLSAKYFSNWDRLQFYHNAVMRGHDWDAASNAEWYHGAGLTTYSSLHAHEMEHVKQFDQVAPEAIKEFAQRYNSFFLGRCYSTLEEAERELARRNAGNDIQRALIEGSLFRAVEEAFSAGEGFREDEQGENEAVEAERAMLKLEYEAWLKLNAAN